MTNVQTTLTWEDLIEKDSYKGVDCYGRRVIIEEEALPEISEDKSIPAFQDMPFIVLHREDAENLKSMVEQASEELSSPDDLDKIEMVFGQEKEGSYDSLVDALEGVRY